MKNEDDSSNKQTYKSLNGSPRVLHLFAYEVFRMFIFVRTKCALDPAQ